MTDRPVLEAVGEVLAWMDNRLAEFKCERDLGYGDGFVASYCEQAETFTARLKALGYSITQMVNNANELAAKSTLESITPIVNAGEDRYMAEVMRGTTIGNFRVEVEAPFPMWTSISYGQNRLRFHHEELDDVIYALKQARKRVRAKLKELER